MSLSIVADGTVEWTEAKAAGPFFRLTGQIFAKKSAVVKIHNLFNSHGGQPFIILALFLQPSHLITKHSI